MELTSPSNIRQEYLKLLSEDSRYNSVIEALLKKKSNEPIFNYSYLNHEEAPSYEEEQRQLSEIVLDLNSINNGTIEVKNKIAALIENLEAQAKIINDSIQKEEERIIDINMLCGINSEYNMTVPVYASDFGSEDDCEIIDNKTIGAKLTARNVIDYSIVNISGNGHQGNPYVYNNEKFEIDEDDRSKLEYIYDNSDITAYEYSRLNTNDKTEAVDGLINYDNKEVEVVLTLVAEEKVCKASILSENEDLILKNLEVSDDGVTFTSCLKESISINNIEKIYDDVSYIYGSNIICFPYSNYIRMTLSSNTIENDSIAIKSDETIKKYPNTKRKKIAINNIALYSSEYTSTSLTSIDILEAGSVDRIGLFLSEYVPDHFTEDTYIKYWLIVNGTEYEIVPVNSPKNGIKIIKFSEKENAISQDYVKTISETIKTASIKITIDTYKDKETPYISNIKLCLRKDTESIYV